MKAWTVSTVFLAAVATARPHAYTNEVQILAEHSKRQLLGCKEATLIFCRGTWEPGGPIGLLVGAPFSTALRAAMGTRIDVKGVSYDAGVIGYLIGGDPAGATTMAKMVTQTLQKCPNTKIILGGYSQGAQVAHLAAAKLSQDEKDKVAAVVVFGDPYKGVTIPGIPKEKVHTICADSDMICWGLPLPIGSHLTYGSDTKNLQAGAAFVKEKVASFSSGSSTGGSQSSSEGRGWGTWGAKGKGGKGSAGSKPETPKEEPKEETKEEPKEEPKQEASGEEPVQAAERLTLLDKMSEDGRVLPYGTAGNPALVGVVESLFRNAYASVGVMPDTAALV